MHCIDLLCIFNKEGYFIKLNAEWKKQLGYAESDLVDKSYLDFLHPDDIEQTKALFKNIAENDELKDTSFRFRHKDKTFHWLECRIYVDKKNYYVSARDITPLKKVKEDLSYFNKLQYTVLDSLPYGLLYIKDRKFEWANVTFLEMFGYKIADIKGESIAILKEKLSHFESIRTTALQKLDKGEEFFCETILTKNSSDFRFVQLNGKILETGNIELGTVWIIQDITKQRKDLENLERFKKSIDNSNDAVYWLDKNAHFEYVNEKACSMFGYSKDELLGNTIFDINPDFSREIWNKEWGDFQKHKKKGSVYSQVETTQKSKDGTVFHVEVSTTHFWVEEKEFHIIHVRDITERKKSEETLKMFKASIDHSMEAVYWIDRDANFKYANNHASKMLGYSNAELLNMNVFDVDPVFPLEQWDKNWEKHLKDSNISGDIIETAHKRKDGSLIYVEVFTNYLWLGDERFQMAHVRNITDKKEAEQELIFSRQMLRNILDNIPIRVFWKDTNSTYLGCNRNFAQDTFFNQEEDIVGKTDYELFPNKKEAEAFIADDKKVMASRISKINFEEPQTREGVTFWVRTSKIPLFNDSNEVIGVLGTYEDITEKKQSEQALKESQQKLQSIFKVVPAGIGVVSNRVITDVNPQICKITGYSKEELLGKNSRLLYQTQKEYLRVGKVKYSNIEFYGTDSIETVWKRKDGKLVDIYLASTPIIPNDLSKGVTFTALDITDRKEAERQLLKAKKRAEESEQRYKALHNASFGGIFIHKDRIIVDCNQGLSDITGYSVDELIGMNGLQLVKEDYLDEIISYMKKGAQNSYETIGVRKNGEEYPLRVEARNIPYKNDEVRVVEYRDITQEKEAEIELIKAKERAEESEFFLQESQQTGNIGSYKMSFKTGYWISTKTLDKIFGIDETFDRNVNGWLDIVHPEDKAKMSDYFENHVIGKQQPFNYEYRIVRKSDKVTRWVHGVGKLYTDSSGNLSEMLGTIQDINERKVIEEERNELNILLEQRVHERTKQLRQANKDLEAFAYSVSHDLRAPIRHIDGFMRLLRNTIKPLDDKAQGYFDKILNSSKGMSVMIDELLKFSRLGRIEMHYTDIDLSKTIATILEQFKPDYSNRNIHWKIDKLPLVKGDPTLLKFAFENLISNAIKYTSQKNPAEIEIGICNENDKNVCIFIKDNGAGFDMAYNDRLFGVFQRMHKSEEFEGIGIGLANVKQIITKHGGTIEAHAEVDNGATFYVTLSK